MVVLHQRFPAFARQGIPGESAVPGTVALSSLALRFEPSDPRPGPTDESSAAPEGVPDPEANGEPATHPRPMVIEIPLDRLQARTTGGTTPEEEHLEFTDPRRPGLMIVTPELDLLEATGIPPLHAAREARLERWSRREMRRRWRLIGWFAAACVVAIALGSFAVGQMIRSIANRVPPEWDAAFGGGLMEAMREEGSFLQDSNAVGRLTELAGPLLALLPPTTNGHQFHILHDAEPNAFALPGGHITVHTGLLDITDQPEELLAVLAHELAHVSERHIYRNLLSSAGTLAVCGLFMGGNGGLGDVAAGGTALLVTAGFSQEFETEADEVGWDYLVRANINPRGMIQVFQKFKAHDEATARTSITPHALQSHPALEKRIRRLENRWRKLRRKDGFLVLPPLTGFRNLPAPPPKSGRPAPNSKPDSETNP